MLDVLAALVPSLVVAVAFVFGVLSLLRREMGHKQQGGRRREEDDQED